MTAWKKMRRRGFISPPFPFTLLEPWQMQLWVNGSLKFPLRLHEGLQKGAGGSRGPRLASCLVYQIT